MAEQTRSQDHDGNWHVLVCGLPRPGRSVILAPGVTLCPLDMRLDVFDLAAVGSVGFREWAALEPIIQYCTCEIESAKDADLAPGFDTLNRAWLAVNLLVLRGFSQATGIACSAYSWNSIPIRGAANDWDTTQSAPTERRARTDLPRFRGQLLDYHLRLLCETDSRNDGVGEKDVEWVRQHFDVFNRLSAESPNFYFALESAIDWRYAKDKRSAVARIWSGIEAIFGISSELVYRISLLSASLLEVRGDRRKARFQQVKKLYGLRSKAVHGASLSDEQLQEAMSESFALLKDLLVLSIDRGHVLNSDDFDESVFS